MCPVTNVMALCERQTAAREAASLVAVVEHTPDRGRNGSRSGADLHGPAIRSVPHHHPARVARQAPRRFRGPHHVAIATPRPAETSYASRVEGPEVGHVNGANKARRGT